MIEIFSWSNQISDFPTPPLLLMAHTTETTLLPLTLAKLNVTCIATKHDKPRDKYPKTEKRKKENEHTNK